MNDIRTPVESGAERVLDAAAVHVAARPQSPTRSILYESHNLALAGGTGIATYARTLAQAAGKIGYEADALFGVARGLTRDDPSLNEVLAYDAVGQPPGFLETVWRILGTPFAAQGGLRPVPLPRIGLVVGAMAETLRPFRTAYVQTRLTEIARGHFKVWGRPARIKLADRPSIFHATHPVPLALAGCPNIYTIHDLVPLRLPYATLDDKRYMYRLFRSLARRADHIVTVSEYSRQDIIRYLGVEEDRVTNTYQTVDIPDWLLARDDGLVAEDLRRHFRLELGGYFLFPGAIEPKKNVSNLVDGYAASGSQLPLVLAGGGGWQNSGDLKKIRDERFAGYRIEGGMMRQERQVRRLDYLPRDHLLTLIRGARAVIFPSIYEGFGLPVAEAMALGTPVITSNVSSLPEIAGGAALLVDPHSVEEIARAISAVEKDADLRQALVERGLERVKAFSREAYAGRLADLYRRL